MSVPDKFANVRRWGQCARCAKFRELRPTFNDIMSEVTVVCDQCFRCPPMTDEDFDLIYDKAGVTGPDRTLVVPVSDFILNLPSDHWTIDPDYWTMERIFPEDD